jgi:predicted MFS family arabinose efflux permease
MRLLLASDECVVPVSDSDPHLLVSADALATMRAPTNTALRSVMVVAGVAMVVETTLYSIMAPLLPHYKHDLGLTKAQAGTLAASYAVGTLIASLPGAALATRINLKGTLTVGLVLMAASSVIVGLAHHVVVLDCARFAQGAAGGVIWSASLAWVSGLAPPDRRGAVLGSLTGIAIGGSLLGPPAGALAVATSPTVVFSAIALISLLLFIPIIRLPSHPAVSSNKPWRLFRSASRNSATLALWLIFAPAMALGLLAVLGPLRLSSFGAGATGIAAIFVIAALAEAFANPVAGRISDRRGLKAVSLVVLPMMSPPSSSPYLLSPMILTIPARSP